VLGKMVPVFGAAATQMGADGQRLGIESALAAAADLLVDVIEGLGHVERRADTHGRTVHMTGADLRHVADAIHLFILTAVLVIVVGF